MGAKAVADAPPEQRAQVAKEETAGFVGGWAGAGLGGLAAAAICSTGWGCVALGFVAVGGGGFAGDQIGRAGASGENPNRDAEINYYLALPPGVQ